MSRWIRFVVDSVAVTEPLDARTDSRAVPSPATARARTGATRRYGRGVVRSVRPDRPDPAVVRRPLRGVGASPGSAVREQRHVSEWLIDQVDPQPGETIWNSRRDRVRRASSPPNASERKEGSSRRTSGRAWSTRRSAAPERWAGQRRMPRHGRPGDRPPRRQRGRRALQVRGEADAGAGARHRRSPAGPAPGPAARLRGLGTTRSEPVDDAARRRGAPERAPATRSPGWSRRAVLARGLHDNHALLEPAGFAGIKVAETGRQHGASPTSRTSGPCRARCRDRSRCSSPPYRRTTWPPSAARWSRC